VRVIRSSPGPVPEGMAGRFGIGVAVLLLFAGPGVVAAQPADGAPAEPSTWGGAALEMAMSSPDGSVDEVAFVAAAHGAWVVAPSLELGAGIDARGHALSTEQAERGSGRAGLGTIRLWVGTGGSSDGVGVGARVVVAAGPSLVDLASIHGGAPEGSVALQIDGALRVSTELELGATLAGGMVWDGGVGSAIGSAQLDAFLGAAAVRPFGGFLVEGSPGAPTAVRIRLGAEIASGGATVTPLIVVAPPTDPEGLRLALVVSLVAS